MVGIDSHVALCGVKDKELREPSSESYGRRHGESWLDGDVFTALGCGGDRD